MKHEMVIRFKLEGDELFPVRFLEWLATELEAVGTGTDDEKAVIDSVDVDGKRVVGEVAPCAKTERYGHESGIITRQCLKPAGHEGRHKFV